MPVRQAIPNPPAADGRISSLLMAFNMGYAEGCDTRRSPRSGSSCLGPCEQGQTVVVYPDATWYSKVTEADVSTILDETSMGASRPPS